MLKSVAATILVYMQQYLPESEWARYNGELPRGVIKHLIQRIQNHRYDIEIGIAAGRGMVKRQRQEQLERLRGIGDISRKTLLEALEIGVDPEEEMQQIQKEMAAQQPPVDEVVQPPVE
jgi:hypothetical protein